MRIVWNPQFERLIASLEILRGRDLLLGRIANEVHRRLRALDPEQEYQLEEDAIRGRLHRVSLANLYTQVAMSPERRDALVDHFVFTRPLARRAALRAPPVPPGPWGGPPRA